MASYAVVDGDINGGTWRTYYVTKDLADAEDARDTLDVLGQLRLSVIPISDEEAEAVLRILSIDS
jgi:hypothetical protein